MKKSWVNYFLIIDKMRLVIAKVLISCLLCYQAYLLIWHQVSSEALQRVAESNI